MNSQSSWARLLKDRVFRNNRPIQHHIFSSIWSSVKEEVGVMMKIQFGLLAMRRISISGMTTGVAYPYLIFLIFQLIPDPYFKSQ
jgi:hypothetical protein